MVCSTRHVSEDGVSKSMAFVDCDRSQVKTVCDVTHCVDVIGRCARIAVHRDRSVCVNLNTDTFKAQAACVRSAPCRGHYQVHLQTLARTEVKQICVAFSLNCNDCTSQSHLNIVRSQL